MRSHMRAVIVILHTGTPFLAQIYKLDIKPPHSFKGQIFLPVNPEINNNKVRPWDGSLKDVKHVLLEYK